MPSGEEEEETGTDFFNLLALSTTIFKTWEVQKHTRTQVKILGNDRKTKTGL
jgi:hypothetical protein